MTTCLLLCALTLGSYGADDGLVRLESPSLEVEIDPKTAAWSLVDARSGIRWPAEGRAPLGTGSGLEAGFATHTVGPEAVRLTGNPEVAVRFALVDDGRSLELRFETRPVGELHLLADSLRVTDREHGAVLIPAREGLLIPTDSGLAFEQVFGSSEYEGCHMAMVGLLKSGSALLVTWDGASVWPNVQSTIASDGTKPQTLTTFFDLKAPSRTIRLTPVGKGDWNALAETYRGMAESKGLAVTLSEKEQRNGHVERLLGASNVKLWTCLERRRDDRSERDEHVAVHWTFDEAAQFAEHLKNDLQIDRTLFTLGGWTEGGYDCRHPDVLPANPECGGNDALANALGRIQALGYVGCLHDNYQDMYRDAKSWNPALIEKQPNGGLVEGGRWLGGRAFIVCAAVQPDLAMRPENMPGVKSLFGPWAYFIDTTYASGPHECSDLVHPLSRDNDIAWKCRLSDVARSTFGLFGSECGREWAIPHSDFFEGITGVGGKPYHQLDPAQFGARVLPFWEMVYHDCQVCYGKYGYEARHAGPYVAAHLLAARPLHYHSMPDHLYWKHPAPDNAATDPAACYTRTDHGWAEGLHPIDAFLKNTHEVLGPLNRGSAHLRLTRFEFLDPAGLLRRSTFGNGEESIVVTVNAGTDDVATQSAQFGNVVLPASGFAIDGPRFAGFYARQVGDCVYGNGALFTLQAVDDQPLASSHAVRVFHGFGDPTIHFRDKTIEVPREDVVQF